MAEWVDDQQIAAHNRVNDMMLELISLKNRFRPGPLMPSEKKWVVTALYDLDTFRKDLFEKEGTTPIAADNQTLDREKTGDLDLLRVAMHWVSEHVLTISLENT